MGDCSEARSRLTRDSKGESGIQCSFSHRTAKVYLPLSFNVTEANDNQILAFLNKIAKRLLHDGEFKIDNGVLCGL
jgi:hypothetical protein